MRVTRCIDLGQRGYTLVEMVSVIAILSIIGMSSSYVVVESMKVYARTAPGLDASYQAHLACERMKRDIRDLGGTASITVFVADALAFDDSSANTISYSLSGGDLTRNGDLLARGVTGLTFTYRKSDGTPATTPAELALVEIDLTVQTGTEPYRLQTCVFPRCLGP
jgi:prepilin-type N-terminal cleavage/methylation domain-containing protein